MCGKGGPGLAKIRTGDFLQATGWTEGGMSMKRMQTVVAVSLLGGLVVFSGGMMASPVGTVAAQEQTAWDAVYTDAQASRGESVYTASCAVCHGDDLSGSEMGPGLAGASFLEFWDGLSLGDLYQVMSVSMPQDNPGSLETSEYVDVIAYMLQKSEYPSGDNELPADEAALGGVMIKAQQ